MQHLIRPRLISSGEDPTLATPAGARSSARTLPRPHAAMSRAALHRHCIGCMPAMSLRRMATRAAPAGATSPQRRARVQRARPCAAAAVPAAPLGGSQPSTLGSPSNLGVLQRVIEVDAPAADPYGMQRVSAESLAGRGLYLDAAPLGASAALLLLLLALTFSRVLGLDRLVKAALSEWKDGRELARRAEVLRAKESLQQRWEQDRQDGGAE